MKKIMMIAAMMLLSVGAFAQGRLAIGANAGIALYGDDYNPFGVGAKLQYGFEGGFRTELAYNYWFAKNDAGVMDIDLNLHYLIPVSEGLNVYPIVGVNLGMTHGDSFKLLFDGQETLFGFQGGFGVEYYLTDNVKLNLDAKYQYNKKNVDYSYSVMGYTYSGEYELKYDGPVIQAGIAFVF